MAGGTVPEGKTTWNGTLVASTVDTITFADYFPYVTVNTQATGGAYVYVTTDGTTPVTTGGASTGFSTDADHIIVLANGLPYWNQSDNVIPAGTVQYPTGGGGTTTTPNGQPGEVQPYMSSLRGKVANPGTVVKIVSTGTPTYTVMGTG